LIERAAIHADADGLSVIDRDFADGGKLFVAALACTKRCGLMRYFVERFGALGIFGEEDVAVVMEVSDDGDVAAGVERRF